MLYVRRRRKNSQLRFPLRGLLLPSVLWSAEFLVCLCIVLLFILNMYFRSSEAIILPVPIHSANMCWTPTMGQTLF